MTRKQEDAYDKWLSRIVRTLAAFVGVLVFVYEVVKGHSIEFGLLAIGMMGLPLGKAVENLLTWLSRLKVEQDDAVRESD